MPSRFIASNLLVCALVTGVALAEQPMPIAVIDSPAFGETVETKDRVIIRMLRPGYPVVAIRSMEKGSKWWIQETVESRGSRTFEVPVSFGNDQTPKGTRFQITALIAADLETAASIQPGTAVERLPDGFAHSEIKEVMVGQSEPPEHQATLPVELLSPVPNGEAKRIQPISLRLKESTEELPRLIVRSTERNASWWVQEPLQAAVDGEVSGIARFGNEKTLAGSKFLLMLVQPEDDTSRALLKTGAVLDDLTRFRCSETFVVSAVSAVDDSPESAKNALTLR